MWSILSNRHTVKTYDLRICPQELVKQQGAIFPQWPTTNTANQLNFEASILGLVTLRSRQRARKWIPYTYDLAFAERTKSGAATEGGAPKAEPVYFALAHSTCPFLLLKAR